MVIQGSFVSQPLHDISVETIRIKEHDEHVYGVGEGIGLRLFFGSSRKGKELQKKEMYTIVDQKLASERESENKALKDLEEMYNKKLEDALAQEQEICRK